MTIKERLLHFHQWLFDHKDTFAIDHPSIVDAYIKWNDGLLEAMINRIKELSEQDVYGQTHDK